MNESSVILEVEQAAAAAVKMPGWGSRLWNRMKPHAIGIIVGALAALGALAAWQRWGVPPTPPPGSSVSTQPARVLTGIQQSTIQSHQVNVYAPKAKAKLGLPNSVQRDEHEHVVTAATAPSDERRHTITTTIDDRTGETHTYDKAEPLPWLAIDTHTQVGLYVGYKNGIKQVERLAVEQNLLQVKALHAQLNATIDSDGSRFAGVGMVYRW